LTVHYFAYGSCMDEQDFKRTVEEFTTLGSATLKDYRLSFSLYGHSRAGGVADVVHSPGEEVQGVLYEFPDEWLNNLDLREGVPDQMYERIGVEVEHKGELVSAYTYQVVNKAKKELTPNEAYVQLMLNGMDKYATKAYLANFKANLSKQFNIKK
jgi:cation transport regulator ChaC